MSRRRLLLVLLLSFAFLPSTLFAQWGDVKFTFLYDGKPPVPTLLPAKTDCVPFAPILDESWVVDAKTGGVKNVVVRLLPDKDIKLPTHPDFEKAQGTKVRIDNAKCRFDPHIAIKYTNQDLVLGNKDGFGHNVKADFFQNRSFNILQPANTDAIRKDLDKEELGASYLSCGIHPHMKGYLFIVSHPYAAVSDDHGNLTIKNVPQGRWTFVMWHEAGGFIKKGKLGPEEKEWAKGRIKVKVGQGINDAGTITFK